MPILGAREPGHYEYTAHSPVTPTSVRTSVTESRCETAERIARMTGGTVRSE